MRQRNVILLVCGLLLLWAISLFRSASQAGTSYSSQQLGTKAIYKLLEEIDFPVERYFSPFLKLDHNETNTLLFAIAPPKMGGEEELLAWVEAGNSVVFFDNLGSPTEHLRKLLGLHPAGYHSDFSFSLATEERIVTPSCPARFASVCDEVRAVSSSHWTAQYSLHGEGTPVIGSALEGSAFFIPRGDGAVWYFSTPDIILNKNIDLHDNGRFVFQLATSAALVRFDEFHHGFLAPLPDIIKKQTELVYLFVGLFILWLVLGVASRFVRFGAPTPRSENDVPATIDFISVLGVLYAERKAASKLRSYVLAWRMRLENCYGISSRLDPEDLVRELIAQGLIEKTVAPLVFEALHKLSSATDYNTLSLTNTVMVLEGIFNKRLTGETLVSTGKSATNDKRTDRYSHAA